MKLVLKEKMSGWIAFNDERSRHAFELDVRAVSSHNEGWTLHCPFRGEVHFPDWQGSRYTSGKLILDVRGPIYDFEFETEHYGRVRCAGRKTYNPSPRYLWASLTTCPLLVYKDGEVIGAAELVYRESPLAFLRDSISLREAFA